MLVVFGPRYSPISMAPTSTLILHHTLPFRRGIGTSLCFFSVATGRGPCLWPRDQSAHSPSYQLTFVSVLGEVPAVPIQRVQLQLRVQEGLRLQAVIHRGGGTGALPQHWAGSNPHLPFWSYYSMPFFCPSFCDCVEIEIFTSFYFLSFFLYFNSRSLWHFIVFSVQNHTIKIRLHQHNTK